MAGETNLQKLLQSMKPEIQESEYVFCTLKGVYGDYTDLNPIASFMEDEGLTLIITKAAALNAGIKFESVFKCITLTIHSSLDAVGLTAAVAGKLGEYGISANVVAAYYHDHVFVQAEKAEAAVKALSEFSNN